MISPKAARFYDVFRNAPKQLDMDLHHQREAGVTLSIAAHMQHIYPIYCGAMPEADAAVAMIGGWSRTRLS